MPPKKPGGMHTRMKSEHFLVGQEENNLGSESISGKLPKTADVLRYFFYRKNLPQFKFKPVNNVICCPMKSGLKVANCEGNPDCEVNSECVVRKVKVDGNWEASGLPIIDDYAISLKIKKLNEQFKNIDKNKKKPNSDIKKREIFSKNMSQLFDISVQNAEEKIRQDRLRDTEAQDEDIR